MQNPTIDEQSHSCFGCSPNNPQGLHLRFEYTTEPATGHPAVRATVQLTALHEGAPGYIHGGIIATLLDEAMSKLNRPLDTVAMTRHLEIDYLRPAPLHQPHILSAHHLSRSTNDDGTPGRKLFHHAELHSAHGTLLARAKGLFIAVDQDILRSRLPQDRLSRPPA